MRHGNFMNDLFQGNGLLFLVGLIIIVAAAIIIIRIINKNKNQGKTGLTQDQKNSIDNFSGLVCAMLTQQGNSLKQNEIRSNLGLPVDIVSGKLAEMEKEGLILRKWENNDYTFTVNKL